MPGRWWIEGDERAPAAKPTLRSRPAVPPRDPGRLVAYREALRHQAALLPRGTARRRAIEKRLVSLTAEILRNELTGRTS